MYYRINHPNFTTDAMMREENWFSVSWTSSEEVRQGLSACNSREDLAVYLAQTGIEFREDWTLVEFEGDESEEADEDTHMGCVLVFPTKIVSTEPLSEGFMDEIFAAYDVLSMENV